ncbi:hypothetical protein TPB0596_31970 [Tsukamurella pulmonis]|nr:hypothetical protein TPB0596_31970 [Tsukamurella pulmonis]
MDPERDLTMDAYRLAQAIKFAAVVLGASMILLGLMVWQPWAQPTHGIIDGRECVTFKDSVTCAWPK